MAALCTCTLQHYPEFAGQPAVPQVHDFPSLSRWVQTQITEPTVMVAQSMGGIIAVQAALQQPDKVRGLVLVSTSGGMDISAFGAADWRRDYVLELAHLPRWFVDAECDFRPNLQQLHLPVLLIWGDADPISPPAVGQYLQQQLPQAQLAVIPDGGHNVAQTHTDQVTALIKAYLHRHDLI